MAIANLEAVARDWSNNGADVKLSKECMQIIIKENITNLKRGGPIQCDMKCLSSSLCKKFRKWAGPFPPKIQDFNLGYGFHTKYTCSHGRILRIKWFIGEKGEIHSAKNEWVENKKK